LYSADENLHATLRELAERSDVTRYVSGPVSYALRLRLPALLRSGEATIDRVAAAMFLSERTLQRRLADEGSTFESLVDDFRREEAARLLRSRGRRISEIARELGHHEPASFSRAFRRWYGSTPSAWRRSARLH
jgi:AraC-like DNA-binding protein